MNEDKDEWGQSQLSNCVHSQKRASYSKSAVGLLPCCHEATFRMRSHRLLRLDDSKLTASCQQVCCKLIVKTFYLQVWCKLFQQLAASVQISTSDSDFHWLVVTWWIQQTCCNWLTTCSKSVKSTTCSKSVGFLAVYNSPSINNGSTTSWFIISKLGCPILGKKGGGK